MAEEIPVTDTFLRGRTGLVHEAFLRRLRLPGRLRDGAPEQPHET